MKCKVDRDLLVLKFLYFFESAVIASLFIYLTPFMYEYGITATELAVINFTDHFVAFFTRPIFGYFLDKFQKYREIIAITALFTCFTNGIQLFIPKHSKPIDKSLLNYLLVENNTNPANANLCFANTSDLLCWPNFFVKCGLDSTTFVLERPVLAALNSSCFSVPLFRPNSSTNLFSDRPFPCQQMLTNCSKSQIGAFSAFSKPDGLTWSQTFWMFLFLKIVAYSLFSALHTMTDSVTFVKLTRAKAHRFGITRMFGAIGILVFSISTGLILEAIDWLDKNRQLKWVKDMLAFSQFVPCFILGLSLFFCVIVTAVFLRDEQPESSEDLWRSFGLIFRNWEIIIFFIFTLIGGFIFTMFMEYYFLILYQMFNDLPKYFPGLLLSIITVSETIFIGVSSAILKYMNDEFWISFSFCFWSIRALSYIFVTNYWLLILIELLTSGPAFGLMLPCMMSHISRYADIKSQGRMQSLFAGIFFNIGGAFGGLYGGIVLDKFGYRGIFISVAILSMICGIAYYPLQILIVPRCCKKKINFLNNGKYSTNEKDFSLIESDTKEVYM